MTDKKGISNSSWAVIAVIIVLAALGIVFTLFPSGNPVDAIGGTAGDGLFYGAVISLGLVIFGLLCFAFKAVFFDMLRAIVTDLGIDYDEVSVEYKKMLNDEWAVMLGKKKRKSDHEVHDDE